MKRPSARIFAAATTLTCLVATFFCMGSLGLLGAIGNGTAEADPAVMQLFEAPLSDVVLGEADAPNTIIEYASLTCSHCANFHVNVFPKLKAKYIDSGKTRFVLRDFPLDAPAVAATMLVRCADKDRFYELVEQLFVYQAEWAHEDAKTVAALLFNLFQGEGFTKEKFNKCLTDKELLNNIMASKAKAHDNYDVDATPTFFVNGKRVDNVTELGQLEALFKP